MKYLILLLTVGLCNPAYAQQHSLKNPVAIYYADQFDSRLFNYQQLVLNVESFSPQQIQQLRQQGIKIFAYLSVGETTELNSDASWYVDLDHDGLADKNQSWNSWLVNVSEPSWQVYLFNKVDQLAQKGIDGLFLDTMDSAVDLVPGNEQAMVDLIRQLHQKVNSDDFIQGFGSQLSLIQNRGFSVIDSTAPYIDVLLFEEFSTHYINGHYELIDNTQAIDSVAKKLNALRKQTNFVVWSLDYLNVGNEDLLKIILERAAKYQFTPMTSNLALSRLDMLNLNAIAVEGSSSLNSLLSSEEDGRLSLILQTGDLSQFSNHQFFINTHQGNVAYHYQQGEADYLIENNALYRYSGTDGDNWEWTWLPSVVLNIKPSATHYTVSIRLSDLGLAENKYFSIQARLLDANWNTLVSTGSVRGVTAIQNNTIDAQLPGGSDIVQFTISQDANQQQLKLSLREALDPNNHYAFFIDTGELNAYFYQHIKSRYLLQDGILYQYAGQNGSWSWQFMAALSIENSASNELIFRLPIGFEPVFKVIAVVESQDWIEQDWMLATP